MCIRDSYSTEYNLSLFELLKSYSTIIMTKDFQKMNIPKLPVFTAEDGIKTIREFFGKLIDWKKLDDLIPKNFNKYSGFAKDKFFKPIDLEKFFKSTREFSLQEKRTNLFFLFFKNKFFV